MGDLPKLIGPLPGPRARAIIERDARVVSPSYTRSYPLVAARGEGAIVEDLDGNRFLDFNAGIAVVATGHCHPRVDELARVAGQNGILLIFDEVQSGMGRTGKMWAAEHFGAAPDILAVAKGIASGMPLGATVARADLMTWPPGAHASTFGGNQVSCAAALVTIALLEEGLMENAARGLGLMIGIELVRDQRTKEKAPELRDRVLRQAFERGLLALGAGDHTIRLCPPLVVTRDQCDFAMETLEECLR